MINNVFDKEEFYDVYWNEKNEMDVLKKSNKSHDKHGFEISIECKV